jgi:hypothetical protein
VSRKLDVWIIEKTGEHSSRSILIKPNTDKETALQVAKLRIQFPECESVIFKSAGSYNPKITFKSQIEINSYEKNLK